MNKLMNARRAAGLSREDLGKAVGISSRTIERYEQGRSDLADASYKTVIDIAKKLKVKPDDII